MRVAANQPNESRAGFPVRGGKRSVPEPLDVG